MVTWGDLLAEIRAELQDTADTKKWSDAILFVFTKDAIRDYSTWFPKRIDRSGLTITDGKYPLPSDFLAQIQVESPLDTFLVLREERPGSRSTSNKFTYYISGRNIYTASTEPVYLTYFASWPVPTSEADTTFEIEIPDSDIELVRIYVRAKAYGQVRSKQANLDRFKPVGNRTDNPMLPETENLMNEYLSKIAQRIPGGTVTLYRRMQ